MSGRTSGTIVATLAALALIATPAAQAAPPANDQASGAELVPGSSFPVLSSTVADISDATTTGDPPVPSCQPNVSRSIWFKITPDQTAPYRIWAAAEGGLTATTVDDTVLAVYTSAGGAAGPFTEVPTSPAAGTDGCDDDGATTEDLQARINSTRLTAGTEYWIVVWKFGASAPTAGNTAVQIRIDRIFNDTAADAELIPGNSFPVLSSTVANITNATTTGDPPVPSCQSSVSRSMWFKFTPDQTTPYRIWAAAEGPTATTVDDTVMAVYTSAGGAAGPFTELPTNVGAGTDGCDDDSATTEALQSRINSTQLNAGTEYWIVVWKFGATAPTVGNTTVQIRIDRDTDLDGSFDGSDNCPALANPGQANNDGDAQGDACDPDDDNDGVEDTSDSCATGAAAGLDTDGDGCKDTGEDSDDDNDGVADGVDNCATGAAAGLDTDGDGCKDAGEDTDDDNDGALNGQDNCQLTANLDQADVDADGIGNLCDSTDNRPPTPVATCTVPKIERGTTLRRTKRKLNKAGCTSGEVTRVHSRRVPRGKLIRLKAKPGTLLAAGAAVDIVVSSGPR